MTAPQIHGRYRTVPASMMLAALGTSLEAIKREDAATDADLGAALGKGEDTAARYRTATADMPVTAFLRGCREWDGRFANDALALIGMRLAPIGDGSGTDHQAMSALCDLAGRLAHALEDGHVTDDELHALWPDVERVLRHFDRLRRRRVAALTAEPPDTS